MPVVRIESSDDPRIDDYRAVSEPALARDRGLFVAEGRAVVQRLVAGRRFAVRSLLLTETTVASLQSVLGLVDPQVPVFVASRTDLSAVAGIPIHRGCLALGVRGESSPADTVVESARIIVILEDVGNADNVGGVFRNAHAFGVDAILLTPGCCDPLYRKAIRTSMAATLSVPFSTISPWPDQLEALKRASFTVVALTPDGTLTVDEVTDRGWPERTALVCGTEGEGLSGPARQLADMRVRIPMRPGVDSLNVAVAAGIVLSRIPDVRPAALAPESS